MNILIVDDQRHVVQGIMSSIAWSGIPEIRDVFCAYNANEAKHIFTNQTIDIIVSDIEMPGENGIQLINWVREHFPETKCIFLTSHADFGYAQNALRLNCIDYILQPVKYEVLFAAIQKAVQQIKEEQENMSLMNQNTFWNMHSQELVQQLWSDFVQSQSPNTLDFINKISKLQLNFPTWGNYAVFIIEEAIVNHSLDSLLEEQTLQTLFEDFFSHLYNYHCQFGENGHQFAEIFTTDLSENDLYNTTQTFIDMCQNNYEIYPVIYFGYVQSLSNIPSIYQQLCQLKAQNIIPHSQIFSLHQTQELQCPPLPSTSHWSQHFIAHTTDLIADTIKDYIERCIQTGSMNSLTLLALQQSFTHAFYTSLQIRSVRLRTIMEQKNVFDAFALSTQSIAGFLHFVDTIIEVNNGISDNKEGDTLSLIEQAQNYINDHLSSELSRKTVAQNIHVSDSYLSHLFQKEMGISLTDYIYKQRMLLAKSMLTDTKIPVNFIAQKTGYNSVSYFIQAFRKEFGITPAEYRKGNR